MAFVSGYTVFLPGKWDVPSFLFSYTMIVVVPILFVFWKLKNRTKVGSFQLSFSLAELFFFRSGNHWRQ
jgi:amino acid permease